MSKSPESDTFKTYLLPLLGAVGLVIGGGYAISKTSYGDRQIELLEQHVQKVQAEVGAAKTELSDKTEKLTAAMNLATSEAARAAELEKEIAAIRQRAVSAPTSTSSTGAPKADGKYGLGRSALAEEITAWDVDVLPDGRGLPEGSGDVLTGEEVFADKCAACHGDFAEGVDNWPVLAGGFDTLADEDPVKTVGSYWPHLSTSWDYIYRSMPFGEAGTLTPDETYAIVAYILYSNDLVDDEFELNQDNFTDFEMHNKDGFVIDDRPALEYSAWRSEPCMKNCKKEVEVAMRSVFLVDTPAEGGTESVMNDSSIDGLPKFTADGPSHIPVVTKKPEPVAPSVIPETKEAETPDESAQLLKAGKKVFKKCRACHAVGEGAKNKSGPHLNELMGRTMGSVDGFSYSGVFKAAAEENRVWDTESLTAFLTKPKSYMKGTKMSFSGLKKEADLVALTEYLKSFSE